MPFVPIELRAISRLCRKRPCVRERMHITRRKEGSTGSIELVGTGVTVTGSETGILELRTGLHIQSLPTSLDIDVHQLVVGILDGFGLFGVGFRRIIAVATRVLYSRVNACVIAFPTAYEGRRYVAIRSGGQLELVGVRLRVTRDDVDSTREGTADS